MKETVFSLSCTPHVLLCQILIWQISELTSSLPFFHLWFLPLTTSHTCNNLALVPILLPTERGVRGFEFHTLTPEASVL